MKRTCFKLLALGVFIVPMAAAQQPATKPSVGKLSQLRHRITSQMQRANGLTANQSFSAQANVSGKTKIWELGTYTGGTWVALSDINEFGMAVGIGDVPPIGDDGFGDTHSLLVPLYGPHAGEWIDLGTLKGTQSRGQEEPCQIISNTGLVATHSTARDGQVHAAAWTKETGLFDLGTLADTHDPRYSSHNSSYACFTNRLGTLITGESGVDGVHSVPVAWTPSRIWSNGEFVTKWQIHALDRKGLLGVPNWDIYGTNDYGQIVATGYTDDDSIVIRVLWNPRADGKGWEPIELPLSPDYPKAFVFEINDKGEISGVVVTEDESVWIPALWKPLDARRTKYSLPIQFGLPEGFTGCDGGGINELGDITGDCWNDTDWLPVHWKEQDPASPQFLSLAGDWGFFGRANDHRIAVFTYGGGQNCPAGTYWSCGGAVQLH